MKSRQEVREALSGPAPCVSTPFLENGDVDYGSLRTMVNFAIDAGIKTLLLTPGSSHYFCLSAKEIGEIAKTTVQTAAGRAMVIAGDYQLPTRKAIAYAQYLNEIKADLYLVYPPNWCTSMTPETCSDHYAAVASIMPVMLMYSPFPASEAQSLELMELTFKKAPNVVALKDDCVNRLSRKMCLQCHEHLAIMSGGEKQNFLDTYPYGCDGYLSTYVSFKPEIAWRFWNAIQKNDMKTAMEVNAKYDMPYFDLLSGFTGSFDAGIHATMELFGLAQRWRRKPYYSTDEKEMDLLRSFFKNLKLL